MSNTLDNSSNIVSLNQKIIISAMVAAVFIIVSLPYVYDQTSKITTTIIELCPSPEGKFIHAIIFFIINYLLMKINNKNGIESKSDGLMAKYAFMGTLLFFLLSSNDSYKMTGRLFSGIVNESGCPEVKGILIHSLVFLVILVLMMSFPKDR